jgi:protein phosphatase
MRYVILSDVHANAAALEAVLDDAQWDEVLFLGDAVNYGPRPGEVVDRLADLPGLYLAGNHDRKILDTDPESCAEDQTTAWKRWTRRQLSEGQLAFLRQFGGPRTLEQGDTTFQLHHGDFTVDGVPDFGGRLWPDADSSTFAALADRYPASDIVHGHTHVQFEVERAGTTFANPGSVGQPRLGQPQACYAILEGGTLTYHATEYDVEKTCAALDEISLDSDFIAGWKDAYQTGKLPEWFDIRDFEALRSFDGVYR